jgi:hypothetical protein
MSRGKMQLGNQKEIARAHFCRRENESPTYGFLVTIWNNWQLLHPNETQVVRHFARRNIKSPHK